MVHLAVKYLVILWKSHDFNHAHICASIILPISQTATQGNETIPQNWKYVSDFLANKANGLSDFIINTIDTRCVCDAQTTKANGLSDFKRNTIDTRCVWCPSYQCSKCVQTFTEPGILAFLSREKSLWLFSALLENVSFVQIQTFKKLAEEHLEIENFKIFISEKALLNHLYTFQPVAQCGPSNQAYRSSLHC